MTGLEILSFSVKSRGEGARVKDLTSCLLTPSPAGEADRRFNLGVDIDLPVLLASMSSMSNDLDAVGEIDLGRG